MISVNLNGIATLSIGGVDFGRTINEIIKTEH